MRLRLIEATVIRLALQGPEGLVVEQITGTAAVARGSFYRHFTSVDDAIEAAKQALTADLIATAKGIAETRSAAPEKLVTGVRAFFQLATTYPLIFDVFARLGLRGLGPGSLMQAVIHQDDFLAEAMASGVFRQMPPALARDLIESVVLIGFRQLLRGEAVDVTQLIVALLGSLGMAPEVAMATASLPMPPMSLPEAGLIPDCQARYDQLRQTARG